ncbi:MAG: hypothetical protein ACRD1V_10545 [Vicinamibacterales bacterium]
MPYQDKDPLRTGIGGKFRWSTTVVSPGVKALVGDDPIGSMTLNALIRRHQNGEWGKAQPEEAAANEQALLDGGPLFSRYQLQGREIWILTEAEPRETTVVRLPEEEDKA